jgi:hypothetical protein
MSIVQQEYISTLIERGEKMSLEYFFKNIIHQKFYSNYDISFMEYFLELTAHDGEFVVHHEKLIEYGIVTSKNSARVKDRLDDLGLVEDIDYSELEDILQLRPQGGTSTKKVYMLTPEAFKTCLMRARKYPNQKVDPVIYSKYYLLLEKQVLEHFVEHYLEEILQFIYLIFKNKLFLKKFISKLLKV